MKFKELEDLPVSDGKATGLKETAKLLRKDLQLPRNPLTLGRKTAKWNNVIGSFSTPDGGVTTVSPKVEGEDWRRAVTELLSASSRISVTVSRSTGPSAHTAPLVAGLAVEYGRRLRSAVRREGPIQLYYQSEVTSRRFRGRLNVSRWARRYPIDPTRFPMSFDEYGVDNIYNQAFSFVSRLLCRAAPNHQVAHGLAELQSAVLPGSPLPSYIAPEVGRSTLPNQWQSYEPAWAIAAPIIRNRVTLGSNLNSLGLEVAVEPWRLLENLLGNVLSEIENSDPRFSVVDKQSSLLLEGDILSSGDRSVIPDGQLEYGQKRIPISFEAKYSKSISREHVFQALTTAAAIGSHLAVLVYPGKQDTKVSRVIGFNDKPTKLVTWGADMFSYSRNIGDAVRASTLIDIISKALDV